MKIRSARGLLSFSLLPLTALQGLAQSSPSTALSLPNALQRVVESNPALIALRYNERAAEALIEQASYRPNPTLDTSIENFLGTGDASGVRGFEATVQASQTIERGQKRERRRALASSERDIAVQEFSVKRNEVLARAALAFVETLSAQQRVALSEEPLRIAQEMLRAVEARVSAGAGSSIDSARARAAIATAQGDILRAKAQLSATRAALSALWGGNLVEVGDMKGILAVPSEIPAEALFLAQISSHPQLQYQRSLIESRRKALELQQAQSKQDVEVAGGVRFLREGSDAAFVAGFSIPVPIRNKNLGNIRAARELLSGAEQSLKTAEIELRTAIEAAWQELNASHATALNLQREILPANEDAYAQVRRAYDRGELPLIDVLDSQRALSAVKREIFEAESAYSLALARLEGITAPTFPVTTTLLRSE